MFQPQRLWLEQHNEKQVKRSVLKSMRLGGVEPPTPALGEPRSIHLSYRRKHYLFQKSFKTIIKMCIIKPFCF